MPATTYLANEILDHILRGETYMAPTGVFISLHTADPGLTGANEVSTGNWPAYVRQDADGGGSPTAGFSAASAKATANLLKLSFPANDGASGVTVTHFGIWDASTGGNCLFADALDSSKTVAVTDELTINIGALTVTVT